MKSKRPRMLSYKETVRFHGHDGPFLALGYRLGKHLYRKLKPIGIMELHIVVTAKPRKPFTCLIDGLQCSTLATMGKGNIVLEKGHGKGCKVLVKRGKKTYTYKISQKALDLCLSADDLERASRRIFRSPAHALWHTMR